ncbi:MAG TPA: PRC-barrel domain-containing protein [Rhizobiaceae bacterium]|nr:PRC-barrel domain-containing protein [Rhizobiaceae bacterium]
MIRKLLATTAAAALLAGGAYAVAQEQPAPAPAPAQTAPADPAAPAAPVVKADGFLASNIIGETVYNGTGENAENIGDVNDIVLAADGKVESLVVGVGGFLGIGEKNVAVEYATIDWAEQDGDRWIVVDASKEQLEALPDFDRAPYDPTPAPVASTEAPAPGATTDTTAQAPATPAPTTSTETADAPTADDAMKTEETAEAPAADAPAATTEETAEAPAADAPAAVDETATAAIDKSTLTEMPAAEIRAEELVGTTVYGANDENIGEIGDVVLSTDGKIDAIVLDVGGFLGVGEKEVAVGMDNLAFMTDKDGNKYLYTTFSKEQLDAQPAYDASTWAEKRDEQRLIMTQ